MKKFISLVSVSFFLMSMSACNNNSDMTNLALQEEVQTFAAAKSDSKDLIKKLVDRRFTFADKNKDKKLAFDEFKGLESEHEDVMKKMFISYDKSKDNSVSYDEFLATDTANANESLKSMFAMLDQSRNKFIDSGSELDMVVEIAQQEANDSGKKLTMEEVKKDFLSYDANKDGKLTYDEFLAPELKYILMTPVDPYKNSINKKFNGISINMLVNNTKTHLKK